MNKANSDYIEYRIIKEFPGYRVGTDGSVWSRLIHNGGKYRKVGRTWKLRKPSKGKYGHLIISLFKKGVRYDTGVHRLVLTQFVGACPEGMEGCHNDGNPSNCTLNNLRWGTPQSNYQDRYAHGTVIRGENHELSKLKKVDILDIRKRLSCRETKQSIANKYNVSRQSISNIEKGKTWSWFIGELLNA